MEDIHIDKTSKTPAVDFIFEDRTLEIKGVSIPEDADTFYTPLLEWVDEYVEVEVVKENKTIVILKLIYFNTSTSDYLVTLLKKIKALMNDESDNVIVEWHYEEDDEDMRETGTHFESILDISFEYKSIEEIE